MTTAVPSVEDVTNAFPTAVTKITGEPNYESLKNLKDELKANAASIPTTLGGGTHGYLGLILSPAAYATIAATQFIEPIYPGQHPNVPAGTSAANTSTIVRRHTEDLRQWREFKNVNTALKNQLLSALDDIYICALKDCHVGYMNQSIRAILQHLFDNYGNITPLELEDNDTKMRATWDPNSPFDCLVKQIEDGQDYADDGGQPYTAEQLLRIAYTLVPTYARFVCSFRPQKPEPYRTHLTVGGNLIDYPGNLSMKVADMTTFKLLVNSTLSTPGAKWLGLDVKNYYLGTPMANYEYMFIPLNQIPQEIIDHYNLHNIVHKGQVYVEIRRGMYGLPQAGILAETQLIHFLGKYGYSPVTHTPGLWRHQWRPIAFCLVVDDFGIKYVGREHADHLIQCLHNHYKEIDID